MDCQPGQKLVAVVEVAVSGGSTLNNYWIDLAFSKILYSNSSRPLNRSTEDSFIQGTEPRPKVNILNNSDQKKTCVQLCLLF